MTYRLGVDIGTTFTAAAVANGGSPSMLGLGNRMLQVPSVLYLPADGGLVVGEAAERRGAVDPSRVVREFKRRIGDHVPMLVAGVPHSPQALTAQLLRWVVDTATTQMGDPPASVVLTHPASWGPYKRELLAQLVELADVGEVETCSEPEAAATQYAATRRLADGERIAMYDLGGGTFDTCVLEKQGQRFVLLGQPIGIEHLGGVDFDDAVLNHVVTALGDRVHQLDPADEGVATGLARLRRDCVEAKEALSSDTIAVVPVSLAGWSTTVRITRAELEDLIRAPLAQTVAAVGRAIRSAALETADISSVVLVGGGSRIPLVSEMLRQDLQVSLSLDTHPKHDVALGAVQVQFSGGAGPAPQTSGRAAPPPASTTPKATMADASPAPAPKTSPPVEEASTAAVSQGRRPASMTAPSVATAAKEPRTLPLSVSRRPALVVGAVVAGLLVVGGVGAVVVGRTGVPAGTPEAAGRTTSSRAIPKEPARTAGATTAGTTQSRSSAGLTLPVSAPLGGSALLLSMERKKNTDIYAVETGQSSAPPRLTRLTQHLDSDVSPSISPDRRSIVFVRQSTDGSRTLRVMAADGSDGRALFRSPPPQCASASRPAWNPVDQTMLAIVCSDAKSTLGLFLVRVDGTVVRELDTKQQRMDDPAFSPDGTQVAYQAGVKSKFDGGAIYRISVTGGAPIRVTDGRAGQDADPVWSNDGESIVFRHRLDDGTTSGNSDIYQVPVDRSASPTVVVGGAGTDQDPSWAPDGRRLAFKSNRTRAAGGTGAVSLPWVVDQDGSRMRALWTDASLGTLRGAPTWSRR